MVELAVTYMEMTAPTVLSTRAPTGQATVAREQLDGEAYLSLYRAVGAPVQWDERLRMPPAALDALLVRPTTHLHVLRQDGAPLGLCEFIGVGGTDVELAHFGVVATVQGRGLGSYLLSRALAHCWRHAPRRIWLKTDTNDHPAAVRTYEKAGFHCIRTVLEVFPD